MYLNLSTSHRDLSRITAVLSEVFSYVELRRIDEVEERMDAAFIVKTSSIEQIEEARQKLQAIAPDIVLSFVEQRNIAV